MQESEVAQNQVEKLRQQHSHSVSLHHEPCGCALVELLPLLNFVFGGKGEQQVMVLHCTCLLLQHYAYGLELRDDIRTQRQRG